MTKSLIAVLGLVPPLALGTCFLADRSSPPASAPAAQTDTPAPELGNFPRTGLAIESGGQRRPFETWVADTTARRAQGLMFVRHLPQNTGMLFLFGEPQTVSMWMKNTLIPLDMLFIAADGRVIRIAGRTEPMSLNPIESGGAVTAVLELGGGECARLGIQVGDYVRHPAFTAP